MSNAIADRNLLFGILALQMDFIRRDALIAAMHAWVLDKTKPLGQILLAQQALAADAHDLLDALVRKHLQLHDDDPAKSLAALSSIGSARQALEQVADVDLHASMQVVSTVWPADDPNATRTVSVKAPPAAGMRFRILRPHAKGGLGQVSVALDEELRREVALKEIQDRHADDPISRSRFLLEAEITGGLEHPGIVPVYGLGQYLDGRPYYAMRFIKGDSLKEAIDQFHQAEGPKRDPAERVLALRQLLRRFIDVCNAMAYAHSRGVLHRDLKPGNIMLGKYGETLVVDWGLAKPLGRTDERAPSDEAPLRPSGASGSAETQPGAAIGTPQFMSPEQAAGRLDQLGPASDVYSLGATLYALLTGLLPVVGANIPEILRKVQRGEIIPPRQAKREVPVAMEAICRKAMALKPEGRYASPRDLADDVEHWLADEPVTAYREKWRERTGRWMRRHRTKVTAAVAALVVAVVTLTTATGLLLAANDRERQAKEKASVRFRLAREAVDRFYTEVSDSPEMKARGVEKLRARLLTSATEYYQQFADEEEGKEPEVQAERARAFHRLSLLNRDIGRNAEAEKCDAEALAIWTTLHQQHPETAAYRAGLATTFHSLALLYSATGRNEQAEKTHDTALAIRTKLAADHPTVAEYKDDLAASHHSLGILYRNSDGDRMEQAEKAYEAALIIRQRLAAHHPAVAEYQDNLAASHNRLAALYAETGRMEQAEIAYVAALALRQQLANDHPSVTEYQNNLAISHSNLAGHLYDDPPRKEQAEKPYEAALVIRRQLANEHPTVTEYQSNLADSFHNLAVLYSVTGRNERATKSYQEALFILRKLAADCPEITEHRESLLITLNRLGMLYCDMGQKNLAEAVRQEALSVIKKQAATYPDTFDRLHQLSALLVTLGQLEEIGQLLQEAVTVQRRTLGPEHPDTLIRQNQLAWLLEKQGKTREAEALYLQTLQAQRQKRGPRHDDTVLTHINLAVLRANQGKAADVEAMLADLQETRSPRPATPLDAATPFIGDWRGKFINTGGQSGAESLSIEEQADGTISGVWSWWSHRVPIRGERMGKHCLVIRGNNKIRVYGAVGIVEEGKLSLYYSAWTYHGKSVFTRSQP